MSLIEKYIRMYEEDFIFEYSTHISGKILDIEIEIDVYEYNDQYNHREKAQVTLKKGDLKYECEFCDRHKYADGFYPIMLNGQQFICFSKTIYGFVFMNADTLTVEYEYFPQCVVEEGESFEESFIIVDVKQLGDIFIFKGCYWAAPYESFAFDYSKKLFLNLSQYFGPCHSGKTAIKGDELIMYGTDEAYSKKQVTVSKQEISDALNKFGKSFF